MKNWPFALWGGDSSDESSDGDDESSDNESSDDGSGDENEGDESSEVLTMTKTELDAKIARAASRASRRAKRDVRKGLGFESQEDLDSFVENTRKAADANKDEDEKLKQETADERAELKNERKELLESKVGLSIDRAIILTGITDEAKVNRIRTLVRSELAEISEETLSDDIADALEAIRNDMPVFFESEASKNKGSGDGPSKDHKLTTEERDEERDQGYRDEFRAKGLIQIPQ